MYKKVEQLAADFYWAEYDLETLKKGMDMYYDMLNKEQEKGQHETKRAQQQVLAETAKDELTGKVKSALRNMF